MLGRSVDAATRLHERVSHVDVIGRSVVWRLLCVGLLVCVVVGIVRGDRDHGDVMLYASHGHLVCDAHAHVLQHTSISISFFLHEHQVWIKVELRWIERQQRGEVCLRLRFHFSLKSTTIAFSIMMILTTFLFLYLSGESQVIIAMLLDKHVRSTFFSMFCCTWLLPIIKVRVIDGSGASLAHAQRRLAFKCIHFTDVDVRLLFLE